MKRLSHWFPPLFLAAIALGLGVLAVERYWQPGGKADDVLRTADAAYGQGTDALNQGDGTAAVSAFDAALTLAGRVLDDGDRRRPSPDGRDAAARQRDAEREGRAFWIKARALRDRAYAAARAVGKPLPETRDPWTNTPYRDLSHIPDAVVRREALAALLTAADRLPGDVAVQKEALRTELQFQPLNGPRVETLARIVVRLDPADPTARFTLAQFDFDQAPAPPEQRSRTRMTSAVEHLAVVKQQQPIPSWRTLALEAQIRRWLRDAAVRTNDGKDAAQLLRQPPRDERYDPDLLLAAAYGHLLLDDLGDTRPPTGEPKDMASALDLWEAALRKKRQLTVSAPLTRAEFWLAAGRPDLARADANRAVREQPKNVEALLLAANLDLEANDPEAIADGIAHVTTLRKLQVRSPKVLLLQAELERRQGHRTAALCTYEALLKEHRQYAVGYARLIEALEEQGSDREVAVWLPYWRGQTPNNLLAVKAEVRFLLKNNQLARAREVAEGFTRGQTAFMLPTVTEDGKYEASGEETQLNARVALAATFVAGKAWDDADTWCRRILTDRPDCEAAQLLLGDVYLGRMGACNGGDRAKWRHQAKETFAAVLAANAGQLDAANNLAWLLAREENQPEKAYQVLQDARTRKGLRPPVSPQRLPAEFLDTLGQTYLRMDNRELFAEMRATFEAALQRYPNDPRVLLHLGRAYAALHNTERADEIFTRALRQVNAATPNGLSAADRKGVHDEIAEAGRRLETEVSAR